MEVGGNSFFCGKLEATIQRQEATIQEQDNINVDLRKTVKRLKGQITTTLFAREAIAKKLKLAHIKFYVKSMDEYFKLMQLAKEKIHGAVIRGLENVPENGEVTVEQKALKEIWEIVEPLMHEVSERLMYEEKNRWRLSAQRQIGDIEGAEINLTGLNEESRVLWEYIQKSI